MIFFIIEMNYESLVTEKQNKLDEHLQIYQSFVNAFNLDDETNDVYRQNIIANIDNLDSTIFNSYKSVMELKASKDFGIQLDTSNNQRQEPVRSRKITSEL